MCFHKTLPASGSWQPLDTRDTLTPVNVDPAGFEHILTDKSIAIQKGVANVTDSTNSPLDILRYTLNFQCPIILHFKISPSQMYFDGSISIMPRVMHRQCRSTATQYSLDQQLWMQTM
jgi:hypothetical protein